jgi:hypothetical protein
MRRRKCWRQCSRALAPPHLLKPRTGASQLRFKKLAPRSNSSEDDLPFGDGNASIGGCTRPYAPVRLRPPFPRASMQKHVRGTRGHAPGTRSCHVSPRCAAMSVLITTSARHISMPRQHAMWPKKKKRKNLVRQNGAPLWSTFILKAFMASPRS